MRKSIWQSALLALLLVACGDQVERDHVEVGAAYALDRHVVWIDKSQEQAIVVDVGAKRVTGRTNTYPVPVGPVWVERRNGHNELLLLTRGAASADASLSLIDDSGVVAEHRLGTRFDRVTQSADGRYAIAWYAPGGARDEESLLINPNELAIIDLDADADESVSTQSLRGYGAVPTGVVFSPKLRVADKDYRVALILFDAHAALIDLAHPERPEYTIEFSTQQGIGLSRVVFSAKEGKIYLLGQQSNDVFVVSLLPAGANRQNDFEPSLNQLGASVRPTDMAVFGSGESARLLAVSGSQILVIEAGSNRVTTIGLSHPASNVFLFEGASPTDDSVATRALVYGTSSPVVTFVDLEQIEERTTRNLEPVRLSSAVASVSPVGDNLVLVARSTGLSLLNLDRRSTSELNARANVGIVPSPELNRLWVPQPETATLGYVDYTSDSSKANQVSVDDYFEQMLLFTSGDRHRVVLTHGETGGAITVLNADDPKNEKEAVTLRGLFYPKPFDAK